MVNLVCSLAAPNCKLVPSFESTIFSTRSASRLLPAASTPVTSRTARPAKRQDTLPAKEYIPSDVRFVWLLGPPNAGQDTRGRVRRLDGSAVEDVVRELKETAVGSVARRDEKDGQSWPDGMFFAAPCRDLAPLTNVAVQGYQMAKNLQSKLSPSDSVRLFDINKDAMHRLAEDMRASQAGGAGVELADNVAETARDADTVITVLPEPTHVKSVYSEILKSNLPRKSRIFIDSSTIDPSSSREVAKWIADANQGQFVDAPMSGGVDRNNPTANGEARAALRRPRNGPQR
ncbi:hypothetical protein O1611_g10298 [Lasiodiplodia mahajangana]|uniref:Uncharacterized protein n=1 Tax=Lasiodiplodia mahajangana TaxID=1108764 RepID=A0ACC2IZS6_9PEZI|nr:hypothetical protein O1611_g10298 [Lasiodiplodia mahajangana]